MDRRIRWLRRTYWLGAVFDGLTLIPMLWPKAGGAMFVIEDFQPDTEYRYAMGLGASLMAGWTFLLLWADRKPVERKGVLLLTVFPVLFGLILSGAWALPKSELVQTRKAAPMFIFQAAITALFIYSYLQARGLEEESS